MKALSLAIVTAIAFVSPNVLAIKKLPECEFTRPTDVASLKAVTAQVKSQCIPKIARVHACLAKTRLLIDQANELSNTFVIGDASKPLMIDEALKKNFDPTKVDLSIWRNFQSLEADYQKALDEIQKFVTTYKEKNGDRAQLQDFIAEMDKGYTKNVDFFANLSRRESALLFYMEKALDLLEKSADTQRPEIQWVLSEKCADAELSPILLPLQNGILDTISKIDQLHGFASRSREARDLLSRYTYLAAREQLVNKYRDQAIADLGSLDGKIDTVLEVSRLMDQFEHWVGWVASDSSRTETIVVYLQFEGTQRIHAADLMVAREFKEKILAASDSHPQVAQGYLPRLDSVIAQFESDLIKTRTKGWQGYLTRQNILADAMLKKADRYPSACVERLQAFKEASKSIPSIEEFRISERSFKVTMKACEVKK